MPESMSLRSTFAAAACALFLSAHAMADTARQINVPAGELITALESLAKQARVDLVYQPEQLKSLRTKGVKGVYEPKDAVRILLKGIPVELRTDSSGAMVIVPQHAIARTSRADADNESANKRNNDSAERIRLAQADQGGIASDVSVVKQPPENQSTGLTEIVVTAQKRSERLQDVPLSISAVTAADIAAKGVTKLEDLQYSIPGLSMAAFGPGQENIQIRGVAAILGRPTTGQYLNELSIGGDDANNTIHASLLDMQRIEVLRGPQATLYGEGSMGGTIRYITTPPDLTSYSASLEAEGGGVTDGGASYRGAMVANMPLVTDKVGLRLVAGHERDGGWIDNTFTGKSNVNGIDMTTVRAELRAVPVEELELSLLFLHQQNDQDYGNFGTEHRSPATVPTYDRDTYNLVSATVRYDIGDLRLVDAAGYIDHYTRDQFDYTPLFQPILVAALGVPPSFAAQVFNPESELTRTFSDELRLSSQWQGGFNWTVGAFYRTSKMDQTSNVTTAPGTLPFEILDTPAALKSNSYSLYAEGSYRLTAGLSLLAGVRYYHDTEAINSNQVNFGVPLTDSDNSSFHSVNPRFNLRYEFSQASMVYLNAAEGFRSGGFNIGTPPGPTTFAPDHIWTYEAGTKQQFLDRKLEFDGAVYYSDWKDVQSAFFPPGSAGIVVTENAGKASGWGADLSAIARPIAGLMLTATYGRNDIKFKTDTADKSVGDPVDYAPRRSYSASIDYRHPVLGRTAGFVRADYQYSGKAQITIRDFGEIVPLPSRDTVNLRLGLDFGSFEVAVFGTNIFNDSAPIQIGPYAAVQENVEQRPRTIGVAVKAHW